MYPRRGFPLSSQENTALEELEDNTDLDIPLQSSFLPPANAHESRRSFEREVTEEDQHASSELPSETVDLTAAPGTIRDTWVDPFSLDTAVDEDRSSVRPIARKPSAVAVSPTTWARNIVYFIAGGAVGAATALAVLALAVALGWVERGSLVATGTESDSTPRGPTPTTSASAPREIELDTPAE